VHFAEVRLLVQYDLAGALLLLIAVELFFRGFLADRISLRWSSVLFVIISILALAVLLPAHVIGEAIIVLIYGAGMHQLRSREDVWTCALAALIYFVFALIALNSLYFSSLALSLLLFSGAVYWRMGGMGFYSAMESLGVKRERLLRNIAFGIVAGFALLVFFLTVSVSLYYLGYNDISKVASKISDFPLFMVVLAVTFAPFSEEVFFRGLLSPRLGAVGSSAIFALVHVTYGSWYEVFGAFAIGYALCWMTKRTGSLVPAIVAHALFNAVSLVFAGKI